MPAPECEMGQRSHLQGALVVPLAAPSGSEIPDLFSARAMTSSSLSVGEALEDCAAGSCRLVNQFSDEVFLVVRPQLARARVDDAVFEIEQPGVSVEFIRQDAEFVLHQCEHVIDRSQLERFSCELFTL